VVRGSFFVKCCNCFLPELSKSATSSAAPSRCYVLPAAMAVALLAALVIHAACLVLSDEDMVEIMVKMARVFDDPQAVWEVLRNGVRDMSVPLLTTAQVVERFSDPNADPMEYTSEILTRVFGVRFFRHAGNAWQQLGNILPKAHVSVLLRCDGIDGHPARLTCVCRRTPPRLPTTC
jgi:hypothetical protein